MPVKNNKLDLSILKIDLPDLEQPTNKFLNKAYERPKATCPNCQGEEFDDFTNDYGANRRCKKCNNTISLGGAFASSEIMFSRRTPSPPITKEQIELEEADRIADIKRDNYYSATNRQFWNDWYGR